MQARATAAFRLKLRKARFEHANTPAGAQSKEKRNEADNRKCQHHQHAKRDQLIQDRVPRLQRAPGRRAAGDHVIRTGCDRGFCPRLFRIRMLIADN
jgi:hypothetical protein